MTIQPHLAMPDELRKQYEQLYHEISDLHFTWAHYLTLFGHDDGRVDLLNECSPNFFALVERELWNSMLLRLTRISADARSGHKASTQTNLTIRALPRLVAVPAKSAVKGSVTRAIASIEFCVAARHKYLAHLALGVALDRENAAFNLGSRKQINGALSSLVALLDVVTSHYDGTQHLFDFHADADALLSAIGPPSLSRRGARRVPPLHAAVFGEPVARNAGAAAAEEGRDCFADLKSKPDQLS